jgi:hypothetical protein
MKKRYKNSVLLCLALVCVGASQAQTVSDYNVKWTAPSRHSGESMPLGNGELGINAWVEEDGDLLFYLSRTDAISEADRLMKLGRVRVRLSPNPFGKGQSFVQTLLLEEGVIEIKAGEAGNESVLRLFMDNPGHVAYLTMDGRQKREVTVTSEVWRRKPHVITSEETFSAWTTHPLPPDLTLTESADTFLPCKDAVSWLHRNDGSQLYDLTMKHQDLTGWKESFPNPISNRTFGCYMSAKGFEKRNDSVLCSRGAVRQACIKIATHAGQYGRSDEWLERVRETDRKSAPQAALRNSRKWWGDFWQRSYVYIRIPDDEAFGYKLTQSCILQRYMAASSGRGSFPIKFNGSIFTADPQYTNLSWAYGPDYRNWGNCFWWQNTRLPYYAMPATGDFDLMEPFFRFYLDRMEAFRAMARKFYGAEGIFIPETVTVFGTYSNGDYGWDRQGVGPGEVTNEYIRHIWVQGLELSKLMLDCYAYTDDSVFLRGKALPVVRDVLRFFDSRFVRGGERMRIAPTQSLETYWFHVRNDLPCVAGLHWLMDALEALPDSLLEEGDRPFFRRLKATLPAIPLKGTVEGTQFIPAQEYANMACNCENPELYAVFPFALSARTDELREAGILAFRRRANDLNHGWGQDGQVAAMLGLTELLPDMLRAKIANTNPNHRFPAMWGPNFDWVPDQDHGSNLLLTVQSMLLQIEPDGHPRLLPAWPEGWDVTFKLHAPGGKVIEGACKQGVSKFTTELGDSQRRRRTVC